MKLFNLLALLLICLLSACRSHLERRQEATITEDRQTQTLTLDSQSHAVRSLEVVAVQDGEFVEETNFVKGDTIYRTRYALRWLQRATERHTDTVRIYQLRVDTIYIHKKTEVSQEVERSRSPTRSNLVAFLGWGVFLGALLVLFLLRRLKK